MQQVLKSICLNQRSPCSGTCNADHIRHHHQRQLAAHMHAERSPVIITVLRHFPLTSNTGEVISLLVKSILMCSLHAVNLAVCAYLGTRGQSEALSCSLSTILSTDDHRSDAATANVKNRVFGFRCIKLKLNPIGWHLQPWLGLTRLVPLPSWAGGMLTSRVTSSELASASKGHLDLIHCKLKQV